MNIAMTGATGYIGKHLSNYLTEKGAQGFGLISPSGHLDLAPDYSLGKIDVPRRYVRTFDSDIDALRRNHQPGWRTHQ
mgnify:CR=1 FL=1